MTQPYILCGMVKRISAFGLSNNYKWWVGVDFGSQQVDPQPKWVGSLPLIPGFGGGGCHGPDRLQKRQRSDELM